MMWIGLTGGIATGKSTIARLLKSLGHPVVDADVIAHSALVQGSPVFESIVKTFGKDILTARNVDRKKLAEIVFKDSGKLAALENIVHPFVQDSVKKLREELEGGHHVWAFYDVPLLFEKKLEKQFDAVIVVAASKEKQILRLQKRNHLSVEECEARFKTQLPIEEKVKKTKYVIWNEGSQKDLEGELKNVLEKLPRP